MAENCETGRRQASPNCAAVLSSIALRKQRPSKASMSQQRRRRMHRTGGGGAWLLCRDGMTWLVFIRCVCPALYIDNECSTRQMRPRCWLFPLCSVQCLGMSSSAQWSTETWAQAVPTTISRGKASACWGGSWPGPNHGQAGLLGS